MSYIVAFVKFSETGSDYPLECFRTDLKMGDRVVVLLADGRLRSAAIAELKYLNWDCRGQVLCRMDEITTDAQGKKSLPKDLPVHVGLATSDALVVSLRKGGWIQLRPSSNVHRAILTYSNNTQTANVFIRRNGVDLQILPERAEIVPQEFSVFQGSISEGRVVRHFLAHTTFNLFDGIRRFSISFQNNENEYDRFFNPVGSKDKRTPKLRELARNDLRDIYNAISGGAGDLAYLSDGIWIGPNGGMYDRGR